VASVLGLLLWALAGTMILPIIVDPNDWYPFLLAAVVTVFFAGVLQFGNWGSSRRITLKGAYLLTASAWLVLPLFGALPFVFHGFTVADGVFETVSGLTTTGSTIIVGLDNMAPALLFWRALLQWVGGVGIIVMSIALLPLMGAGGMQLFRTESSDRSDRVLPRAADVAAATAWIYAVLSAVCAVAYYLAGMSAFDAICHAMTTLSTGGFSTHDASIAYYHSLTIYWIGTVFMLAGSIPFVLYIRALRLRPLRLTQIKLLITIIICVSAPLSIYLYITNNFNIFESVTLIVFNVVSIITTTGFVASDYTQWGYVMPTVFFFLTFLGGCTGSTSGGIKMMRLAVMFKTVGVSIKKLVNPHGIFVERYDGQVLERDVMESVAVFMILYLTTFTIIFLVLEMVGLDFETTLSGAATALGNVGPGIGPIIGPSGTFASLPDAAKWVLSVGMLLGRLEFFTLLVLLTPSFWRN
jgi:trk system potassium uptake protein